MRAGPVERLAAEHAEGHAERVGTGGKEGRREGESSLK